MTAALTRALRFKLIAFACLCAYVVPMQLGGAYTPVKDTSSLREQATWAAAVHGCWSDQAPADMAGVMPGAMVTTHGEYVTDAARVAAALDAGLAGRDTEAYAFCRGGAA